MNRIFFRKEILLLLLFFFLFMVIHSVNFSYHLNFTNDQALFSTKTLEIFRSKKPVLIGPPISINFHGREVFQGPAIYYQLLFFLVLGNFDPIASSFAFTIFCALMIFPLYYGVKYLLNEKSAFLMVLAYSLIPYYIDYTRFLWNPNFQFSLLPILILLMGLYKKRPTKWRFFLISFTLGLLFQYHYQFIIIIFGLFIYYFFINRGKLKELALFVTGLVIGFSPVILFELRNNFYNTKTLILFWENRNSLTNPGGGYTPHYYLSISFFVILGVFSLLNWIYPKIKKTLSLKYNKQTCNRVFYSIFAAFTILLFFWAASINIARPAESFNTTLSYAHNWNYLDERQVYEIIKKENLSDYNVADLTSFDTLATVVKYLLIRDNVKINYDDYYHNKYLFVVYRSSDFSGILSYEVATFTPRKTLKTWRINDTYNLYLFQRVPKNP